MRSTTFKVRLHRNTFLFGVAFCLAFVLTMITVQDADAHNIGWRWKYPSVAIKIEAREMPYGFQVVNGCLDYGNNTDINGETCSLNTYNGNIIHIDGFWDTAWKGYADAFSSSVACATWPTGEVNGYCNETDHQVDFAYVYWNDKFGPYSSNFAEYMARHETGHVFGLAHPPCTDPLSVMRDSGQCSTVPINLTSHDISDINVKY